MRDGDPVQQVLHVCGESAAVETSSVDRPVQMLLNHLNAAFNDGSFIHVPFILLHFRLSINQVQCNTACFTLRQHDPELDGSDKSIASVLKIVTEDLNSLKKEALSIRAEADEDGNFDIANLMEDHLKDYSKTLWFLSAMRK